MEHSDIIKYLMNRRINGEVGFVPLSEIARGVGADLSNTGKILIRLFNLGLVERENHIRRCSYRIKQSFAEYKDREEK